MLALMQFTKDIITQLILINEAIRTSIQIQENQLSEIRSSSERYRSGMESLQRRLQDCHKDVATPRRRTGNHHVPEGRETGIPLQAGTQSSTQEMEHISQDVHPQHAQTSREQEVPLYWEHGLDNGSRYPRLLRVDELRSQRNRRI